MGGVWGKATWVNPQQDPSPTHPPRVLQQEAAAVGSRASSAWYSKVATSPRSLCLPAAKSVQQAARWFPAAAAVCCGFSDSSSGIQRHCVDLKRGPHSELACAKGQVDGFRVHWSSYHSRPGSSVCIWSARYILPDLCCRAKSSIRGKLQSADTAWLPLPGRPHLVWG